MNAGEREGKKISRPETYRCGRWICHKKKKMLNFLARVEKGINGVGARGREVTNGCPVKKTHSQF